MQMMLARVWIVAVAFSLFGERSPAAAQTFDFSADEFRAAFNARLKQDGRDPIATCRSLASQLLCHFQNDPFRSRTGKFARIDQDEIMTLEIIDKRVAVIALEGQRSTPRVQNRFIGQVSSAIGALDSTLDNDKIAAIVSKLGLSRGDDAPNIGEAMSEDAALADIQCLNQYSSVTPVIACIIVPPQK
jgi:hypothetical protein